MFVEMLNSGGGGSGDSRIVPLFMPNDSISLFSYTSGNNGMESFVIDSDGHLDVTVRQADNTWTNVTIDQPVDLTEFSRLVICATIPKSWAPALGLSTNKLVATNSGYPSFNTTLKSTSQTQTNVDFSGSYDVSAQTGYKYISFNIAGSGSNRYKARLNIEAILGLKV